MTREEAMAVIMRLNIITTGAPSAWIEATIRIVQAAAAAERKAIQDVLWDYAGRKDLTDDDESLLAHLNSLIRARGET